MPKSSVLFENMTKRIFIHIDADAFFASVEQCLHRELRGKAIVTGRDGSIAVALSYEAKALGVKRATPIHIIRKEFPTVKMVASDYYMYKIYSDRMLSIISEHIPNIKRKSVDECSAEITDLIVDFDAAEKLTKTIQEQLQTQLSCSFSFGISTSSLLAKMASGMNKPSGLTIIDPENNTEYYNLPIKEVSGLGKKLCERLSGLGVVRIKDFIEKYPSIRKNFSLTTDDIFYQLQGKPTFRNILETLQKSMNRSRSFKVSDDKNEVYGQLVMNFEHLMRKMRAQSLLCRQVHISLKNAERNYSSLKIKLPTSSRDVEILLRHVTILFNKLWDDNQEYRYVSITFSGLSSAALVQADLFGQHIQESKNESVYRSIDLMDEKFGTSTVSLASTLIQPKKIGSHINPEKYPITMTHELLPDESVYKRLQYPYLGTIS